MQNDSIEINENYTQHWRGKLEVAFQSGRWYEELYDENYFKSVHIISNGYGIKWGNGQDIAPHELYDMSIAIEKN